MQHQYPAVLIELHPLFFSFAVTHARKHSFEISDESTQFFDLTYVKLEKAMMYKLHNKYRWPQTRC
jgi:hypothetical protein